MAAELAAQNPDWKFKHDSGRGWRRVVPSPAPTKVVQIKAIKSLVEKGFFVIAGGGGGIPAVMGDHGSLMGVDAVVDKDLTSSLLAKDLGAELLIISTSVPGVYLNFGQANQKLIKKMTIAQARKHLIQGQFGKGSMEPKIKAAVSFLEQGGDEVIITDPEHLRAAYHHEAGTLIVP
jgi:carbamate kinase